ncbi:MAG TPA: hypothetical protein VKR06_26755, partial [Ktedonosporobacter sp.]|nr:hypothetical protein [Ktedonosporobacter sp.]
QTTLVIATKEWHGWTGRDRLLIAECLVPSLTPEESVCLLQRLGLDAVPIEHLQTISAAVAYIPLCLEWIAQLAHDPLVLDDWSGWEQEEEDGDDNTRRFLRLLEHPSTLEDHLANRLAPLLQRILETRLSRDALAVLEKLAMSSVPLGKPALQILCPRPAWLKELRDTSLLASSAGRVQVLPVVAATLRRSVSAQQRYEAEEVLIQALKDWIEDGSISDREAGSVITELATFLLKHHQLLDAAQLFIRFGGLAFQLGNGPQLAHLAEEILQQYHWQEPLESWCGGIFLSYMLPPLLGKQIDKRQRAHDYQIIRELAFAGTINLRTSIKIMLTHYLMLPALHENRFLDAQDLLETCTLHLEPFHTMRSSNAVATLTKHGLILSHWCEYLEERHERQAAREKREQAIVIYQQAVSIIETTPQTALIYRNRLKKQLAYVLHYLGYHLFQIGQHEQALQALQQSIDLQEQGYGSLGGLSPCYADITFTLIALGRFQEAQAYDEKNRIEVHHQVQAGYAFSQEDVWVSHVPRGYLSVRLGRVEEAESLLKEALLHIPTERRVYRMCADEMLSEIERWRHHATDPTHYQLDWRWVERYRALASYDTYWWLGSAGPFTEEEQQTWNQLFLASLSKETKEQLSQLMAQSTRREVHVALSEKREPQLHYPAIDIAEIRERIDDLLTLDQEISQQEPNAIVRRLYHGTLEEEIETLRLIEATYQEDGKHFQHIMFHLIPPPTPEEMQLVLSRVRRTIIQGLFQPETRPASEHLICILQEQCGIVLDLVFTEEEAQQLHTLPIPRKVPPDEQRFPAQAVQRFFEAILQEAGFEKWSVVIDPNETGARVEQGLRCLFLRDGFYRLEYIKHLLTHELAGHVARCVAGERSLLGLLGIHTKNSLETEEGLVLYYELQDALQQGEADAYETRLWPGTLSTGLASGVISPPQTFQGVYTVLEALFFLRRRLRQLDSDEEIAHKRAGNIALKNCLQTFRGVPDLTKAGVCFTQDVLYLRGLLTIQRALAREDQTVLDLLAAGVVSVELLPDLRELGIGPVAQPLRRRAEDPQLDVYIHSFL